jgi:hypothetical protein
MLVVFYDIPQVIVFSGLIGTHIIHQIRYDLSPFRTYRFAYLVLDLQTQVLHPFLKTINPPLDEEGQHRDECRKHPAI